MVVEGREEVGRERGGWEGEGELGVGGRRIICRLIREKVLCTEALQKQPIYKVDSFKFYF